jgi:hypothetical protein
MPDPRPTAPSRRERLEALLAGGQARLERARSRCFVVDTMVETVRRERPVAVGLAASLAFRLFALLIPLAYVLVAGFGFAAGAAGGSQGTRRSDRLGELVVDSVAAAARGSDRARWLALAFGGVTTLVAAAGVVEVLRWIHLLAWRMPPARSRPGIWRPLGVVAGLLLVIAAARVADQARVDAKGLTGELGVIVVTAAAEVVLLALLWLLLSLSLPRPAAAPWPALAPGPAA